MPRGRAAPPPAAPGRSPPGRRGRGSIRRPARGPSRGRPSRSGRPRSPLAGRAHVFAELVQEARLAVGRQRHDLVLVAGAQEAEVLGEVLVHEAQRVREALGVQRCQDAALVRPGQVRVRLAAAVEDQHVPVAGPGAASAADAACATWCGTYRTIPGSSPAGPSPGSSARAARTGSAAFPTACRGRRDRAPQERGRRSRRRRRGRRVRARRIPGTTGRPAPAVPIRRTEPGVSRACGG